MSVGLIAFATGTMGGFVSQALRFGRSAIGGRSPRALAARAFVPCAAVLAIACAPEAEPRGQVLLFIDTDLPVVGQLGEGASVAPDAALDTVRIDAIASNGAVVGSLLHVAPDPLDWPVSLGVVSGSGSARLRVRAFRAEYARSGEIAGAATLDPLPALSIDRLMDLSVPESGVSRVSLVLHGDCLGVLADFESGTSCVNDPKFPGAADAGLERVGGVPSSLVGTWPKALPSACPKPAVSGRRCVPGGFSVLGEVGLVGAAGDQLTKFDPSPPRPVVLSPFHLDQAEYTVGRLRALLASDPGALTEPLPSPPSPEHEQCTWTGTSPDSVPLTCVPFATARQLCQLAGGDLPTEAQWEHAARGRGRGSTYPWGNVEPECCSGNVGGGPCDRVGPAAVGSFVSAGCLVQDASVDGVWDLAGNVRELVRDSPQAYDGAYWGQPGILTDPVVDVATEQSSMRGASWLDALSSARASLRRTFLKGGFASSIGFRCAYGAAE